LLSGKSVTFTFNGVDYDVATVNGVAKVTVSTPAPPGSVAASVKFAGDHTYAATSDAWTISIK